MFEVGRFACKTAAMSRVELPFPPPGIEIDTTVFRLANYIELATDNLSKIFLIAAILLILVLIVFYW